MHRLHAPTLRHEFVGQPIQQSRMGGTAAPETEIVDGGHESPPEVAGPETIHDDPGHQRILPADQPAGEAEPIPVRVRRPGMEHCRDSRTHLVSSLEKFPAMPDSGGPRNGALRHDQSRGMAEHGLTEHLDLLLLLPEFRSHRKEVPEESLPVIGRRGMRRNRQDRLDPQTRDGGQTRFDLASGKRIRERRHSADIGRIACGQHLDQKTVPAAPRYDGRPARPSALPGRLPGIQPKPARLDALPVARVAVLLEDGLDVAVEIDWLGRGPGSQWPQSENQGKAGKKPAQRHVQPAPEIITHSTEAFQWWTRRGGRRV